MHSTLLQSILDAEIEAEKLVSMAKDSADSMLKKELDKIERDKKKFLSSEQNAFSEKLNDAKAELEKKHNDFLSSQDKEKDIDAKLMQEAVDRLLKEVLDI